MCGCEVYVSGCGGVEMRDVGVSGWGCSVLSLQSERKKPEKQCSFKFPERFLMILKQLSLEGAHASGRLFPPASSTFTSFLFILESKGDKGNSE